MNYVPNYKNPFSFQQDVTAAGTPESLGVKLEDTTVAFVDGVADADTITDSGNGFVVAGFEAGDQLVVTGSASNDGTYVVDTVAAGTITLKANESLTDELASATVTLKSSKHIPDGIKMVVKAKQGNTSTIHVANSAARALNSATAAFVLRLSESLEIKVTDTENVWIDAAVSGEGVEVFVERDIQA